MGLGASVLLSWAPTCCRGSAVLCCYLLASGKAEILCAGCKAAAEIRRKLLVLYCYRLYAFLQMPFLASLCRGGAEWFVPTPATSQHRVCSLCRKKKRLPRRAVPSPCHVAATALHFHVMWRYEHHGAPSSPLFPCYSSTNIPPGLQT